MRPRVLVILIVLAALPVGLAVALGAGSGGPGSSQTSTQVSISLVAGTSVSGVRACGIVHHYRAYSSSSTISFRGLVSPGGTDKVKVKLKVCSGGTFQPSGAAVTHERSNGVYRGSFPAPIAGYYFARAEVKQAGVTVARSNKRYFEVR